MCLGGGSFDTVILFCILVFFISLIELISGSLEDISIIIMVGNILIILRVWLLILIFIINYNPGRIKIFFSLLLFINLILVLCFKVQSLLGYYFFFWVCINSNLYVDFGLGVSTWTFSSCHYNIFLYFICVIAFTCSNFIFRRFMRHTKIFSYQNEKFLLLGVGRIIFIGCIFS